MVEEGGGVVVGARRCEKGAFLMLMTLLRSQPDGEKKALIYSSGRAHTDVWHETPSHKNRPV